MPLTYLQAISTNNELQDLTNSIGRINANPYIDCREKIRLSLQLGIRLIYLKLVIYSSEGLYLNNIQNFMYMQDKILNLLTVPAHDLLDDEQYFSDFSYCAYNLGELGLIQTLVNNGARLFEDQFFTQIYMLCLQQAEYNWFAQTALTMITPEPSLTEAKVINDQPVLDSRSEAIHQPGSASQVELYPTITEVNVLLTRPESSVLANVELALDPETITELNVLATHLESTAVTHVDPEMDLANKAINSIRSNISINEDIIQLEQHTATAEPLSQYETLSLAIRQFDAETINQMLADENIQQLTIKSIVEALSLCKKQSKNQAINIFVASLNISIDTCIQILQKPKLLHCVKASIIDKLVSYDITVYAAAADKQNILNICARSINRQFIEDKVLWDILLKKNREYLATKTIVTATTQLKTKPVDTPALNTVSLPLIKPVETQAIKPKIKTVALTPIQMLNNSIISLDSDEFNSAIATYSKLGKESYLILKGHFTNKDLDLNVETIKLRDFLLYINISDANRIDFICDETINKSTRILMLPLILRINDQVLFTLNSEHSIHQHIFDLIGKDADLKYITIVKEIIEKLTYAHEEAAAKANEMYTMIYTAQPNQNLESKLKKTECAINIYNDHGQSMLMAAIEKGLSKSTILYLIAKSDDSILLLDNTRNNVFHYWAKYLNTTSLDTINALWLKFKEVGLKDGCVLKLLNSKSTIDGNTFMHMLLLHKDQDLVASALEVMFSIDSKMQFSSAILVKNFAGDTPIRMLKKFNIVNKRINPILLKNVTEIIAPLCFQYMGQLDYYFPPKENFFTSGNSENGDVLYSLMLQQDYSQLMTVINERNHMRFVIRILLPDTPKKIGSAQEQALYEHSKNQILNYFGTNEFLFIHEGRTLFDLLTDHIIQHPELESEYQTKAIHITELESPLTESLAWKKILKHFTEPDPYTLSVDQLNTCVLRIKPIVDDLDSTGRSALDHAILSENLAVVRLIIDQCGAEITDRLMCNAIGSSREGDDMLISDLLYSRHRFKSSSQQRVLYSFALMSNAAIVSSNITCIDWLISKGFLTSIICPHNKVNVVQLILSQVTDENLPLAIKVIEALLRKKDEVQKLFEHKDPNGHNCLHYVHKHAIAIRAGVGKVSQDGIDQLYELLLKNGASRDLYNKLTGSLSARTCKLSLI